MIVQNCATDSVDVYSPTTEKPWNYERVAHLYNRLGFGADYQTIQDGLVMNPSDLVDQLLDNAAAMDVADVPYWADYTNEDYGDDGQDEIDSHINYMRFRWIAEMVNEGIKSRITFFWHNHFVTETDVYSCPSYMWKYYELLHVHALGNFKQFVSEMGLSAAMLIYLNGNANEKNKPNENYARELMELFTMGESNGYTQNDIAEVAKALTGWRVIRSECTPPYFDPSKYNDTDKTIFGMTGPWNYDDVHDLIFTYRREQTAANICRKIYTEFVSPDVNESVVASLAETFESNEFQILPVFKKLFKSEHFFDSFTFGNKIKSPIQLLAQFSRLCGQHNNGTYTESHSSRNYYVSRVLEQQLFDPINVAGWPGNRTWINENTLTLRWSYNVNYLLYYIENEDLDSIVVQAIQMTNNSNVPMTIVTALARHFFSAQIPENYLDIAVDHLKNGIPENYFEDGSWNLYWEEAPMQIRNVLEYFIQLPEFQLV